MTEQSDSPPLSQDDGQPVASEAPTTGWAPHTAAGAAGQESAGYSAASVAERPEVMVGAAFAGGFLTAMILKRLVR